MPFCPNCGYQHEGAKFCPECGHPQNAGGASQQPPLSAPPEEPEQVVWEGESKNLTNLMSGGRWVTSRYQLSNKALYFDEGLVSTTSQQVPLWAVRDIDVHQRWLQKARGTGDVVVHVQHSDYTGRARVALVDIEEPLKVRNLLNEHAQRERLAYDQRQHTRYYRR